MYSRLAEKTLGYSLGLDPQHPDLKHHVLLVLMVEKAHPENWVALVLPEVAAETAADVMLSLEQ